MVTLLYIQLSSTIGYKAFSIDEPLVWLCRFDIECVFVISIVGFSSITFWGLLPLEGSMVTPLYIQLSSTVHCFSFISIRLFSILFYLKKAKIVKELEE